MDISSLLTPEEISVIRNAQSRFSDCLIDFVRENANDITVFEEEKNLIIESMRDWWVRREWKFFLSLIDVNTDFLVKDPAINLYLADLLKAQEEGFTKLLAYNYFEFSRDQYHDGNESFYSQMRLDRMDETWKLFREAINLDPTNVEIRSHFIGSMHQGGDGAHTRIELLKEIQELLQIPIDSATTFGKSDPKTFYDYPRELLLEFQNTGKLLLDDDIYEEFLDLGNAMTKGTVYNDMLTFLMDTTAINIMAFESNKTAEEYFSEGTKYYNTGKIKDAILALRKSITLAPNLPEAHCLLGKISLMLLLTSRAIEEFTIAIKLNPEIAKYHYYLGEAHLADKNNQKALIEYENALKLNPFFEEAQNRVCEITPVY